jgi:hypothetical protein
VSPLQGDSLLQAWEAGRDAAPAARALALLAAAHPREGTASLRALTVGVRDARLLELRRAAFGPRMQARVRCPGCGEALEMEVDAGAVLSAAGEEPDAAPVHRLERGALSVRFRLPSAGDLADVGALGDAEAARLELLRRCVAEAAREVPPSAGEPAEGVATVVSLDVDDLSDGEVAAIAARMAELDPMAEVAFALACEACGTAWESPLDVGEFLWAEVDRAARRVLDEVHLLASAYGWTEEQVLALRPARRRAYIERVAQ